MNSQSSKIATAIGCIDEDLISAAQAPTITKRNPFIKLASIAVCLCLVLAIPVCIFSIMNIVKQYNDSHTYIDPDTLALFLGFSDLLTTDRMELIWKSISTRTACAQGRARPLSIKVGSWQIFGM